MWRDLVFDNLTGDLEYHPKRAAIYLALAAAALGSWIWTPGELKFALPPLLFGSGGLALLLKGIFLLRRSSDGIGNSTASLGISEAQAKPAHAGKRKTLPATSALAAQMVQDFGSGCMLAWPVMEVLGKANASWKNRSNLLIFLAGLGLFGIGWLVRKMFAEERISFETK